MNKKSIFFTFTAILMVSVIVVAFASDTYITRKNKIPVVRHRVRMANNYVSNIKNIYLERALYATSYKALYALAMEINQSEDFFERDDFEKEFKTAVLNATINNVESDILKGKSMIDTFKLLENLSQQAYHINTSFEKDINRISVKVFQSNQTGPWQVGVNMTLNYFVDAGIAVWNVSEVIQTTFSITDLDDPLYLVGTEKEFTNKINQTPFETWHIDNLRAHIINRTYKYDPEAPNFLMRFYGETSASFCCGIESLVYEEDTGSVFKSFVDCAYWDGLCGQGTVWNITGFGDLYPDDLRLDTYHANVYNVTDYIES